MLENPLKKTGNIWEKHGKLNLMDSCRLILWNYNLNLRVLLQLSPIRDTNSKNFCQKSSSWPSQPYPAPFEIPWTFPGTSPMATSLSDCNVVSVSIHSRPDAAEARSPSRRRDMEGPAKLGDLSHDAMMEEQENLGGRRSRQLRSTE